jgi:hypothetical protein
MTNPVDKQAVSAHGMPVMGRARQRGVERVVPRAHFPHHEMLRPSVMAVMATICAIFVLFAVAVAPSGTDTLTWLQRALYFGSIAAFGLPSCYSMVTLVAYFTRTHSSLALTLAALAVTVLGSVPVTAMVCVYPLLFYPGRAAPQFGMAFVTVVAPATSACLLLLSVVHQRIRDYREVGSRPVFPRFRGKKAHAVGTGAASDLPPSHTTTSPPPSLTPRGLTPTPDATTKRVPNFLNRLPADLDKEIVYIKTEGHYLRVYTKTGTSRLLMRFADAVAELSSFGMQTHRSYWAAHEHMLGVTTRNNRTMLRLNGGYEVPVSRTYMKAVRDAVPD